MVSFSNIERFCEMSGTETCLRVGGRVRAEYLYLEPVDRTQDTIGFRTRGRINFDARTATAYGALRTYMRFELTHNTGAYGSDTAIVKRAFVEFGGLTASRAVSFFTNPNLPTPNFGDLKSDDLSNAEVNLFAYTFFSNGFSAILSLEDGTHRQVNNELDFPLLGVATTSPVFAPLASTSPASGFRMSLRTSATPAPGAERSSPVPCTRSATWRRASRPWTA